MNGSSAPKGKGLTMKVRNILVVRSGAKQKLGTGRKSWEIFAHLTADGRQKAREFATRHMGLLKGCAIFTCSPLICAQETLGVMMDTLGFTVEATDKVAILPNLWTTHPESYASDCLEQTLQDFVGKDAQFAVGEGIFIYHKGIMEVLRMMTVAEEIVALSVSNRGPIDFLLAYAHFKLHDTRAFERIYDLGNCEGMVLTFEGEDLTGVVELRDPLERGK